jgi:hypothetical protein
LPTALVSLTSIRRSVLLLAAVAMTLALSGGAAAGVSDCRVSLAVNPVKIAYGLANLEIECQTAPRVAVVVWGECLFSTHVYGRGRHPDAVGRIGIRLFQRCRQDGRADGFSAMPFVSRSWTKPSAHSCGIGIGAEAAYRWQGSGPWFGSSKALLTWPLGAPAALPGIEMMLGYHCH